MQFAKTLLEFVSFIMALNVLKTVGINSGPKHTLFYLKQFVMLCMASDLHYIHKRIDSLILQTG